MLKVYLVRHSMTEGNLKKRYIGTTDEPLCEEGRKLLESISYPSVEAVYTSPRKRCRETAEILYPGMNCQIIENLAECDFGEFENKNYLELSDNVHYQQWIDSNGTLPFPGGDSKESFRKRVLEGFEEVVADALEKGYEAIAAVVHGGTIMNLLEAYEGSEDSFYQWHVDNGRGYKVEISREDWKAGLRKLQKIEKL